MVLVDVIVPVFNTKMEYLLQAIDGLRKQTLTDWAAWIVDDGSDEAYGNQLRSLLTSYDDVRFNHLYTQHKGATGSRNVAIKQGCAPYIALLDSDDFWLPEHLAQMVACLERDEKISLAHGHYQIIDSQGLPLETASPIPGLNELDVSQTFARMLKGNFIGASTVVVRRKLVSQVDGFDASLQSLGDKDLWLRMLSVGAKFHYIPEVSVHYRVHPGNVSHKTDLLFATRHRIIEKAAALIRENELFTKLDWPAIKAEMTRHMYREATEVHFSQGRFAMALRYGVPWNSGISIRLCSILLRSAFRILVAPVASLFHYSTSSANSRTGKR